MSSLIFQDAICRPDDNGNVHLHDPYQYGCIAKDVVTARILTYKRFNLVDGV